MLEFRFNLRTPATSRRPPFPDGSGKGGHLRGAFTLVELLVVVGIVALLIGILMPALTAAREQARSVACLSNLRQLATAAHAYANSNRGRFPIAQYKVLSASESVFYSWDFIVKKDFSLTPPRTTVTAGLLWEGKGVGAVQQCPSFDGKHNSFDDPYTGYNYNVSYVGHGEGEAVVAPAKMGDVKNSHQCALFGDGQTAGGANKYMRSPFRHAGDEFEFRYAGTQGFRHRGRTNVAFADGHAESLKDRFTTTHPGDESKIASGTGFLSEDNSMYDLQ